MLFIRMFQFPIFADDAINGNTAERAVEEYEKERIERTSVGASDAKSAIASTAEYEVGENYQHGNSPYCEFYPVFKDFFAHFVGDEGEDEGQKYRQKNLGNLVKGVRTITATVWGTKPNFS